MAFTAATNSGIECRTYPPELAGDAYPEGTPVYPEEDMPRLITEINVDVVFSRTATYPTKRVRVLVVEDGPTVTHGNMPFGVATIAARQFKAKEILDTRPYAICTIKEAYKLYPHMGWVLPAWGTLMNRWRN